jgi:hypothetical protein
MRGSRYGAAVDERHAPPSFEAPEPGARVAGHPQVAPRRQLHAAGDAPALDGGDDRLGELEAGGTERARWAAAVGRSNQVGAGAERGLVAGQHRDPGGSSESKAMNARRCSASAVSESMALRRSRSVDADDPDGIVGERLVHASTVLSRWACEGPLPAARD